MAGALTAAYAAALGGTFGHKDPELEGLRGEVELEMLPPRKK